MSFENYVKMNKELVFTVMMKVSGEWVPASIDKIVAKDRAQAVRTLKHEHKSLVDMIGLENLSVEFDQEATNQHRMDQQDQIKKNQQAHVSRMERQGLW